MCPTKGECAKWAYEYMNYCLCSASDWASMSLGLVSVFTWTVAEIPQIITNYKQKSTDGLSLAFLATWIIGDICNVVGCLMEPATLRTQYYTAALYTTITSILVVQALYYEYLYPKLRRKQQQEINSNHHGVDEKDAWICRDDNGEQDYYTDMGNKDDGIVLTGSRNAPFNVPSSKDLYYMSARSLNKSSTPPVGSFLAQKMASSSSSSSNQVPNSYHEPLLASQVEAEAETEPESTSGRTKPLLSVVSTLTLAGTLNLCFSLSSRTPNNGLVIQSGRQLLEERDGMLRESGSGKSNGIASFLGWVMAVIYMGGRFPQIFLNMKKGNVEGLNPLMFLFALLGNATYVGSILANSMKWSDLRPNMPWLVDAAGCVILDAFILIQFLYYYEKPKAENDKEDQTNAI